MIVCDCRHRCTYPAGTDANGTPRTKTRDQAPMPCGFEIANTIATCPKRRKLQEGDSHA